MTTTADWHQPSGDPQIIEEAGTYVVIARYSNREEAEALREAITQNVVSAERWQEGLKSTGGGEVPIEHLT